MTDRSFSKRKKTTCKIRKYVSGYVYIIRRTKNKTIPQALAKTDNTVQSL